MQFVGLQQTLAIEVTLELEYDYQSAGRLIPSGIMCPSSTIKHKSSQLIFMNVCALQTILTLIHQITSYM